MYITMGCHMTFTVINDEAQKSYLSRFDTIPGQITIKSMVMVVRCLMGELVAGFYVFY